MADMFINVIPELEAGKEISIGSYESRESISESQPSSIIESERERHTTSTMQEMSGSEDESRELRGGESEGEL
eukprot:CAMPEP_0202954720 /NCGR_PEP_ID=MMETSP1395-20130829/51074_1 /ASSEMBLY_ACC=CAM_ASM_000871 /TAXON_ID=5961 /ORGANISM="Blepharisma japonicum, Strain Stock R1072" /LENGTH=72 /DNA_ID=CAMNT_0049670485 /DNA_START=518 /DNA_END=733 /DNA_ORIENTATION=-